MNSSWVDNKKDRIKGYVERFRTQCSSMIQDLQMRNNINAFSLAHFYENARSLWLLEGNIKTASLWEAANFHDYVVHWSPVSMTANISGSPTRCHIGMLSVSSLC